MLEMSITNKEKCLEIIRSTEVVADKILMNKQELLALDKRRQDNRQAIRSLEGGGKKDTEAVENKAVGERKVWITIGSLLVKMEKEKALTLLKKDQMQTEKEIQILRSDQKVLVNQQRDLEYLSPYSGSNLKSLDPKEIHALKSNLPML